MMILAVGNQVTHPKFERCRAHRVSTVVVQSVPDSTSPTNGKTLETWRGRRGKFFRRKINYLRGCRISMFGPRI